MTTAATITAIFLLVGLVGLGIAQTFLDDLPQSALAGAVAAEIPAASAAPESAVPTQRELNICMNECMDECVHTPGDEQPCLALCDTQCGA